MIKSGFSVTEFTKSVLYSCIKVVRLKPDNLTVAMDLHRLVIASWLMHDLDIVSLLFKPGMCQPAAGVHLVS